MHVDSKNDHTVRKKILAISYLFPNPEKPNHGIFVYNRLNAMAKYADITVINPIPWSPIHLFIDKFKHLSHIPSSTQRGNLSIYHPRYLSIPGHFKALEILSYRNAVKKVIKKIRFDFDLIDLHWTFPDLPAGDYLSNRYHTPYRVTLRGMEAFHQQDGDIRERTVAKYLKKVDSIISLSEEMADTADRIASSRHKTKVVRNGVDTDAFFYKDKTACRNNLEIPSENKVIIGVGALIYRKGFDVVINALSHIVNTEALHNTHFYILGAEGAEGDYRKELRKLVFDLQLSEHVHFVGAVPNEKLIDWYNAADLFCLSSRGEGSPNVLTEALACGCPALATKVGSVPEIMASEPNLGKVVSPDDNLAIVNALIMLLQQDLNREELAKSFRKYTWDWCSLQCI
ncbi:glycosyltransferase [Alteromonas macleodii]|uniref:glycosyltransferase n=1 Tax=Alteromonas macleodii TaxID=28108 RepID=UPI0001AEB940|nr:group 1 glycosyl transferase [Alteromonas macleodii ATCC 27126]